MARRKRQRRKHRKHSRQGMHGLFGIRGLAMGGQLSGTAAAVVPPLVAVALSAGTALGIRAYVDPAPGTAQGSVYKFAPLIGAGVGVVGSLGLAFMGGKNAAISSALSSVLTGAVLMVNETVVKNKAGALATLFPAPTALTAPAPAPTAGWGALVPEYARPLSGALGDGEDGMGGIVMEQVHGLNAMGDEVNLAGRINASAYGTSPFGEN